MITPQIKERAQALRNHERPEHTVDTDLPQELAKLPGQGSFSERPTPGKGAEVVPYGACHTLAPNHKRSHAHSACPGKEVLPSTGLLDEGHPTILAPTRL